MRGVGEGCGLSSVERRGRGYLGSYGKNFHLRFSGLFYGRRRGTAKERIMIPIFSKCDPDPSVLIASNLVFGIEVTLNAIIIIFFFFQTKRRSSISR